MESHSFDTFTFLKLNFEIPLLMSFPRGALVYERFLKLTFNTEGGDSYLNEFVYAERWQIILEVSVQLVYNLGNCFPFGIEFFGDEIINNRAVTEVNTFKKRF